MSNLLENSSAPGYRGNQASRSRPVGFEEARWITSEDVNVEHLLDVSISTDPDADDTWDTKI